MLREAHDLITTESPSHDLDAVAESGRAVARVGRARLGCEPDVIVIDGCTHLRWRFGTGRRHVLVLGHHDTVWPVGSLVQHPATVRDGVLLGPGCLDMKVGLVMAFHALAALDDLDGVTLLVTGDEEIGSPTSRGLIESEALGCEAVLVLEAAADGGALKVQRKGRAHYTIRVAGRAAHAGLEPEKGVNAAIEMAHHIVATQRLADTALGTSVTPSLAVSGTSANTVPDAASFTLDVRAVTVAELERVHAALQAWSPVLDGAVVTVEGSIDRPPLERSASAGLYAVADELAPLVGEDQLNGAAVGGGSDGNLTAALGIPTLDGLGGVGGGAHADSEHVIVEALPARTALVALLVARALESAVDAGGAA